MPDLANRNAVLLGDVSERLCQLLTPFLGQGRDRKSYDFPVVRRSEAEVRGQDSLFYVRDGRRVPRLNQNLSRVRSRERCHLIKRRGSPIVICLDMIQDTY